MYGKIIDIVIHVLLYIRNTINTQHCQKSRISVLLTDHQFIYLLPSIELLTNALFSIGSTNHVILMSQYQSKNL